MIILSTIAFIIFSALIDAEHIKRKQYFKDHTSRFILRGVYFITIGIYSPLDAIGGVLLFAATFDQVLNYAINKPIFYLGVNAKWDIFFNKYKWLYITVKIITLISSIIIFVL